MGFEAENIRDWQGRSVVDPAGGKIGSLEAIYVDTVSDEPVFATVVVGMLGRRRLAFVPLTGATVAPDHVRVTVAKGSRQARAVDRHRRRARGRGRAGGVRALRPAGRLGRRRAPPRPALRDQTIATGSSIEPVAPWIFRGNATKRNSYAPALASSSR
jgi:hypothetical protein